MSSVKLNAQVRAQECLSAYQFVLARWKYILQNYPRVSKMEHVETLEDEFRGLEHEANALWLLVWNACITRTYTEDTEELAMHLRKNHQEQTMLSSETTKTLRRMLSEPPVVSPQKKTLWSRLKGLVSA